MFAVANACRRVDRAAVGNKTDFRHRLLPHGVQRNRVVVVGAQVGNLRFVAVHHTARWGQRPADKRLAHLGKSVSGQLLFRTVAKPTVVHCAVAAVAVVHHAVGVCLPHRVQHDVCILKLNNTAAVVIDIDCVFARRPTHKGVARARGFCCGYLRYIAAFVRTLVCGCANAAVCRVHKRKLVAVGDKHVDVARNDETVHAVVVLYKYAVDVNLGIGSVNGKLRGIAVIVGCTKSDYDVTVGNGCRYGVLCLVPHGIQHRVDVGHSKLVACDVLNCAVGAVAPTCKYVSFPLRNNVRHNHFGACRRVGYADSLFKLAAVSVVSKHGIVLPHGVQRYNGFAHGKFVAGHVLCRRCVGSGCPTDKGVVGARRHCDG